MTGRGYSHVLYFELSCRIHGDWRSAYAADSEFHLACPRCGEAGDIAILGRGLTKSANVWRCVSPALPQGWKTDDRPALAMQRGTRKMTRARCQKFWERARAELAGIR